MTSPVVRLGEELDDAARDDRANIGHLRQCVVIGGNQAIEAAEVRARSFAVASPTLRMPSAKMKRASVVCLLARWHQAG
jgi:hypothetical protein